MVRPHSRFTSLALSGCLLVLLAACGPFGSADSGPTPTAETSGRTPTPTTGGVTATPTTAPMPATQTTCPTSGTARAAVFAPLVLGSHQNIVYLFNQGISNQGTTTGYSGEIKRYDATTGKKVLIVNTPTSISGINDAQISPDGQWILFTIQVSLEEVALQLVRMDGQGLQTLYCSSTRNFFGFIQWSPDQKTVAFLDGGEVDLLDLAAGHLQVILMEPTGAGGIIVVPTAWLDDTHLYVQSTAGPGGGAPLRGFYVLDTAKGANQQVSDLIQVFDFSGPCLSFDSSVDKARLFISTCNHYQGPSAIIAEPALGGPQTTVYSTPTLAITTVRVISRTTMLLCIGNAFGDTSHNGLWKMNLDGTGLTRLTTAGAGHGEGLNVMSQFPWSNVSRDGTMYALESGGSIGTVATGALLIGSLGGSSPSTFATFSGIGYVAIVGWTTM